MVLHLLSFLRIYKSYFPSHANSAAEDRSVKVVNIRYDGLAPNPRVLSIQKGTIINFSGTVTPQVDTTFLIRRNGFVVASTSSDKEWSVSYDSKNCDGPSSNFTITWFRNPSGREKQMARFDLNIYERSPFSFSKRGVATNGDLDIVLKNSSPIRSVGINARLDGKPIALRTITETSILLPISGLEPGAHRLSINVTAENDAPFDGDSIDFELEPRLSFTSSEPTVISRSIESSGKAVRIPFIKTADFPLRGIVVNPISGWDILTEGKQDLLSINPDLLPEGTTPIVLKALGPDGTLYLSKSKSLTVKSTDDYFRFKAVSTAGPLIETQSRAMASVVLDAIRAENDVSNGLESQKALDLWKSAMSKADRVLESSEFPDPMNLDVSDPHHYLKGITSANRNPLSYGRKFLQAMALSWTPVPFSKPLKETASAVRARIRALDDAERFLSQSRDETANLVKSFATIATGLDVPKIRLPERFGSWSDLKDREGRRKEVLQWLASLTESLVYAQELLVPSVMRSRSEEIKTYRSSGTFAGPDLTFATRALHHYADATKLFADRLEFAIEHDAIMAKYIKYPGPFSAGDRDRLSILDNLMSLRELEAKKENLLGWQSLEPLLLRNFVMTYY